MSRARLVVVVDLDAGDIAELHAHIEAPTGAAPAPAPPTARLRFPKANALRAAVAALVTAARLETRPCSP